MRIYAIHKSADDWHPDVSFYQVVMFHGEAIVPPQRRGIASHDLDEHNIEAMRLVVNGYRLADVFLPSSSCNLVVSECVMSGLQSIQSCFAFAPVAFEKEYSLPWPWPGESDVSISPTIDFYRRRGNETSIANAASHDENSAASLPPYYELVGKNHYQLLERFSPTHRFFTEWYDTEPVARDLLPVCQDLFRSYPITHAGHPLIRDDIFEALSPYMNQRMFGIKEFTFGDDARISYRCALDGV